MMTRRSRSILLAAGALAIGSAAIAQDKPESLLPPGFGEPAPTPSATAAVPPPDASGAVVQPLPGVTPLPSPSVSPSPSPSPTSTESPYQLPAFARRPLSRIGIGPSGMPADAFGGADGRTVEILMRRLSAPLPSRWLSIALRRLLVAPIDTPRGLDGADFAAERAWLLLRMGESVAARAVAEGVDTDNVTPKLRQVWMQAALANADPAGLCALAPGAGASERGWVVARAMCATLSGAGDGPALLRDVRRRRIASGIDLQLAQKVMGAGLNSRQAITIDWAPVVQLNAWRFGLATATGVAVPDELYATVGAQVTGWRALAPAIPLAMQSLLTGRVDPDGLAASIPVWAQIVKGEGLRLITGHGFDSAVRAIAFGFLPERTPRGILFEVWYELGALGAIGLASIAWSAFRAAGRAEPSIAPFLLAALACAFTIGVMGLSVAQLWWVTLLGVVAVSFAIVLRGHHRVARVGMREAATRRPAI